MHNVDSITNADWNFLRDCTSCSLIGALIKSREIGMASSRPTLTDCPLIKRPTPVIARNGCVNVITRAFVCLLQMFPR